MPSHSTNVDTQLIVEDWCKMYCQHFIFNNTLFPLSWWRKRGAWSTSLKSGNGLALPASWDSPRPKGREAPSRLTTSACSTPSTSSRRDRLSSQRLVWLSLVHTIRKHYAFTGSYPQKVCFHWFILSESIIVCG